MQNHTMQRVAQNEMKVVIGLCARSLRLYISPHRLRETEQEECLINQMRTQIVEDTRAWLCPLTPTIANNGTIAIIMRLIGIQLSQQTTLQEMANGQEIVVP